MGLQEKPESDATFGLSDFRKKDKEISNEKEKNCRNRQWNVLCVSYALFKTE